ncbi:MAG: ribonuclease H-like domain-containing protein, partial [Candidatus Binatia bacterium]|nr:ribonuclease H-like domain-containing protein [Candidatus Binatia bacterium]
KSIERSLGFAREGAVGLLDGWGAVLLWDYHTRGQPGALTTLVRYNLEDVIRLPALLAVVYNTHAQHLPFPVPPVTPLPVPAIPFEYDEALIHRILVETGRWPPKEAVRPSPSTLGRSP